MLDRTVFAPQTGWVIDDRFTLSEPLQNIGNYLGIGVELGDRMANVFGFVVTEQSVFCPVRPQDRAIGADFVQAFLRVIEEVG